MRSRVEKVVERPRIRGHDRDSARRVVLSLLRRNPGRSATPEKVTVASCGSPPNSIANSIYAASTLSSPAYGESFSSASTRSRTRNVSPAPSVVDAPGEKTEHHDDAERDHGENDAVLGHRLAFLLAVARAYDVAPLRERHGQFRSFGLFGTGRKPPLWAFRL